MVAPVRDDADTSSWRVSFHTAICFSVHARVDELSSPLLRGSVDGKEARGWVRSKESLRVGKDKSPGISNLSRLQVELIPDTTSPGVVEDGTVATPLWDNANTWHDGVCTTALRVIGDHLRADEVSLPSAVSITMDSEPAIWRVADLINSGHDSSVVGNLKLVFLDLALLKEHLEDVRNLLLGVSLLAGKEALQDGES